MEELLLSSKDVGRGAAQKFDLKWALESLFARIERGLQVEVRFLPPPASEQPTDQDMKISQAFSKLEETASELKFPSPEGAPILSLPAVDPESTQESQSTNAEATKIKPKK